jgi:hypothetical protein
MKATVEWERSPAELAKDIKIYGKKVEEAIEEVSKMLAKEIEMEMKSKAPWKDQTGKARRELAAEAGKTGKDIVEMFIVHGVDYGVYLELARGQRYAIIQPTMQRMYPTIKKRLKEIFK